MRRSSSTSRSELARRLLVAGAAMLLAASAADARPGPCLPPLFEGGQRTHAMPSPTVHWLELVLRQHEICWREPASPGEQRIALVGNSAVYGMPLPAEASISGLLNREFARRRFAARTYNLAFVFAFQLRDAYVIHAALGYQPDLIVYGLSLGDFIHFHPYRGNYFTSFFLRNQDISRELLVHPPAGLSDPIARFQSSLISDGAVGWGLVRLHEVGAYLRAAAHASAGEVADLLGARPAPPPAPRIANSSTYRCDQTLRNNAEEFRDWKQWNILAYLQEIRRTRGVEILVVNLPVLHMPRGACYNVRYGKAVLEDFVAWAASETRQRGLAYLDLHDRLPADAFVDSAHMNSIGQQRVAEEIARALDSIRAEKARGL
jgi:hypothetical protein